VVPGRRGKGTQESSLSARGIQNENHTQPCPMLSRTRSREEKGKELASRHPLGKKVKAATRLRRGRRATGEDEKRRGIGDRCRRGCKGEGERGPDVNWEGARTRHGLPLLQGGGKGEERGSFESEKGAREVYNLIEGDLRSCRGVGEEGRKTRLHHVSPTRKSSEEEKGRARRFFFYLKGGADTTSLVLLDVKPETKKKKGKNSAARAEPLS